MNKNSNQSIDPNIVNSNTGKQSFISSDVFRLLIFPGTLFVSVVLYVSAHMWTRDQSNINRSINLLDDLAANVSSLRSQDLIQSEDSKEVNQLLDRITDELDKIDEYISDRNSTLNDIQVYVGAIQDQVTSGESPSDLVESINNLANKLRNFLGGISAQRSFFWIREGLWVEIIFWSLFGAQLYGLKQVSDYLGNRPPNKESSDQQKGIETPDRREGPVNYPRLVFIVSSSPFLSLVLLFILRTVGDSFGVTSIALTSTSILPLLSIAFILGYQNKLALAQLEIIIESIFSSAGKKTLRKIYIHPEHVNIHYGGHYDFSVFPDVKVKWSIWSKPSVGVIDASTGFYIASPKPGVFYDPSNGTISESENGPILETSREQVIIKAEREDAPEVTALAVIYLTKNPIERIELTSEDSKETAGIENMTDNGNPTNELTPEPENNHQQTMEGLATVSSNSRSSQPPELGKPPISDEIFP